MKKTLLGILFSTGVIAFTTVGVLAEVIDNGDGTQTINGESDVVVPITGTLGVDNTDPDNSDIPETDPTWINVTVPSKTIFVSGQKSANAPITSPNYTVKNNSGRGVSVTYSNIEYDGVLPTPAPKVTLNLLTKNATSATSVNNSTSLLVEDTANPTPTLIANLGAVSALDAADGGSVDFTYGGTVGEVIADGPVTVNYNMTLTFAALAK